MATLHVRLGRYLLQQAPRRVFWAVLTGLTGLLISFIQQQFNGSDIDALAAQYAATDVDPIQLIKTWPPDRRWLAGVGLVVDTVLFIPAYALTLAVWCRFFALHSLFTTNPFRPYLKYMMQGAGKWIVRLLLVSIIADSVENISMGLWLGWAVNIWPSGGWMTAVRVLKFTPVILAIFYIMLHPLGVVLSFREAFFRFIGLDWYSQEQVRTKMMDHITSHRSTDLDIRKAVRRYKREDAFAPPQPLSVGRYIITVWKGFLNVQFVVYLLLLMAGLFQLDQFDELFYFLLTEGRGVGVVVFTMLALCAWSGMVYVCSKILLFIQPNYFDGVDADKVDSTARALDKIDGELAMLRNTPLWLSQAPFWLMFLTLVLNFRRLAVLEQRLPDFRLKYAALLLLLSLFYVAFWLVIRRVHNFNDRPDRPERRWSFALFKPDTPANDYALLVDRVPYSILYGQGVLVLLFLLFLPTATGLVLAQGIGLYAIVMLWLTGFAYMGTLLYQFNQLPKYPVLVVLVIAVLLFSRVNDNSDIRQSPVSLSALPGQRDSLVTHRPGIDAYYTRWLATRQALDTTVDATLPLPVVVIATAGGGIRAAAWTTNVLTELNNSIPSFDHYLFAISGVSGGGVGAATYLAALGGQDTVTTGQPTRVSGYVQLAPRLRRVVTEDLISPIAASTLFRGGIHNFTPFQLPNLDRNRWLEDAWERQMLTKENMPNDSLRGVLSESFLALWPDKTQLDTSQLKLPALLLNGAVAETGQKIVMSNLALGNTTDQKNSFYDVADLFASTGHDVPYKTATFLCARFPFVTSGGKASGTLPNILANCGKNEYHIIDGGYAENTGIVTAVQLIKKLQLISSKLRNNKAIRRPIAYYLLFLPNYAASQEEGSVSTFRFLAEPINGLLNTWNRNGVSLDQLIGHTLQGSNNELSFNYASLTLNTRKHRYPLGWYISPTAYNTMTAQAAQDIAANLRQEPPEHLFFRPLYQQIYENQLPKKH